MTKSSRIQLNITWIEPHRYKFGAMNLVKKYILSVLGFFLKLVKWQWYFGIFWSKVKDRTDSMNHDIHQGHELYIYIGLVQDLSHQSKFLIKWRGWMWIFSNYSKVGGGRGKMNFDFLNLNLIWFPLIPIFLLV